MGTFGLDPQSVPINPAVARWLRKLRAAGRATPVDELRYLHGIHKRTAWIDIRGLQVGAGRAHRFPIRELFIPLAAVGPVMAQREAKGGAPTLPHQAGWLPHFLCAAWREACPDADEAFFRSVLEQGRAAAQLDGLDEAPHRSPLTGVRGCGSCCSCRIPPRVVRRG